MNCNFDNVGGKAGNFSGRSQTVVELDTRAKFVEIFLGDGAGNFDAISFVDLEFRMNQRVRKFAVVRQENQTFGIKIEPTNGINSRGNFLNQIQNRRTPALVLRGRNVAAWFVQQNVNFFSVESQRHAVDANFIFVNSKCVSIDSKKQMHYN